MLTLLQALLHVSITYMLLVIGGTLPVLKPPAHGRLEYDKFIVLSNDSLKFNFLMATFYFSKSEFRMKCEAISAIGEQVACREPGSAIVRTERLPKGPPELPVLAQGGRSPHQSPATGRPAEAVHRAARRFQTQ
jgi:hypothetical protein